MQSCNLAIIYKTWIEINKKAVAHNIGIFRKILKKNTKLFAVVKSNAYGHGLLTFSGLADRYGVDGFCVDSVIEGVKLRNFGIKKQILVLGPTLPNLLAQAVLNDITITISNFDALKEFIDLKSGANFHLKIDTGMHRQGFYVEELSKVFQLISNFQFPIFNHCRGVYTHFAAAKDITYSDYTLKQIGKFNEVKKNFLKADFKNLIFHAAATGGAILYPQSHFDAVRIGLGLYGFFPTKEIKGQHNLIWKKEFHLQPILQWKTIVSEIKQLSKGDYIGYDLSERVKEDTISAVLPIGYWHGFPRSLSQKGEVIIKGKRARVLGRVSMDLVSVEILKNTKIKRGDTAVLIGSDGREEISAEELADLSGTIHYEFLTRLNPLIKRVVV